MEIIQFGWGEKVGGGAVVALDAFDGLHPGHLAVIEEARAQAKRLGAPLAVLSFEPFPRRMLQPHLPPFALMNRDQEVRALARLGVDTFYVLVFSKIVTEQSDDGFAQVLLRDSMAIRHAVASARLTYGKERTGSARTLQQQGAHYGFGVSILPPLVAADGNIYSADAVRALIAQGRVRDAVAQLGRHFTIAGSVQHGAKLGRTIGFPTANISLGDYIRPEAGIYASVSQLEDGRRLPGLAYLGRRPTVDNGDERLEVFLYDFDGDLYGQPLETALVDFIRPDKTFDTFEAMQVQMENDRIVGRPIAFEAVSQVKFAR